MGPTGKRGGFRTVVTSRVPRGLSKGLPPNQGTGDRNGHTGGTPFSEHHQIDPREGRYEKRRIRNSSHSSNNGTSYMNWRSWSCVNIRRMSACSKTWLNQARSAEGSREPRKSRQSSGVFCSTHLHWKSMTSGNVICFLPCLTRIESGLSSNNIGALAAFNPALLLVTN